jgi:CheY-like chemotaxis protein
MRFNKTTSNNYDDDIEYQKNNKEPSKSPSIPLFVSPESNTNNLIVVGTIKVDEHSRLTFSKRIKTVLPISAGDTIVVYKELATNDLIFKIQRYNEVFDTWSIKRKKNEINTLSNNSSIEEKVKNISENSNKEYGKNKKLQPQLKSDIKIMIIDDEPDILETYKSVLLEFSKEDNEKPYVINTFISSVDAAIHFLEINRNYNSSSPYYDLIIIDVKIPDLNGIQLYQILKIINLNIKILFISALDAVNDLVGVLPGIGSEDIIKKPFNIGEFYSKVKEKINSYNYQ